jgi:16S rRNA C967 or C1407 C5-methylase (RsmB/RsmF family)
MAFDRIAASAFREHRLGSRERRMTGDFLFATLRFFPMLLGIRWNPENADDLRKLDALVDGLENSADIFGDLLKRHEDARPIFAKDPERHLREIHGMPEFMIKESRAEEWPAWHDYLHDSLGRATIGLRVPDGASAKMSLFPEIHASEWINGAYLMDESRDLAEIEAQVGASIEVQDEHSQIVGRLLGVEPGMRVLDLCAGAGGKALQIADQMQGRGEIFVNDVSTRRLEELKKRARRLDIANIRTWNPSADKNFDRILIDAPCLGLGTLRRAPERLLTLTRDEAESMERTQKNLLDQALAVAGRETEILYVTCSVRPAENLEQFSKLDRFEFLSISERLSSIMGESQANEFLTLARASSAYRISRIDQLAPLHRSAFLQWGPGAGSQVSGRLKGDAFFVALVKCRDLERKNKGADS